MSKISKKLIELIKTNPNDYAENAEINNLVNLLRFLSNSYYNSGVSIVSDEIFDILRDKLKERDPDNPYLTEVGAPISKDKITLPYPMMSLDKIKKEENLLDKWKNKYKGPYIISDKLDGVSALLYKTEDNELKLYTRGDGKEGQDITHLIKYVIPNKKKYDMLKPKYAIRGELVISRKNFKKIETKMANARNAVSGQVNAKKPNNEIIKLIDFVSYNIIYPAKTQFDQLKLLEEWDFKVVNYIIEKEIDISKLDKYLNEIRKISEYEIDGIVITDTSKTYDIITKNPEHAFAYKNIIEDQVGITEIEKIIWTPSKDGYIKPRIQVKPIKLSGTTITYATAFNAKYVKDNNIGAGSVVKIVRSGDVIPYILEVIKPSKEADFPKDLEYKWNDTNVDIIINNKDNKDVKINTLSHFFSKFKSMNIGEGIITKLVDNGYDDIFKILNSDKKKLVSIEGLGTKMITKIFDNIEHELLNTELYILMAASNVFGRGLGEKKIKLIIDKYPDIMENKWSDDKFMENIIRIHGFSMKTAYLFVSNFNKFKEFYNKLDEIIDLSYIKKKKEIKKSGNIFKNETIVFTGIRDKNLEKYITDNGGDVKTSVSTKTTLVIYTDEDSSKYKKALELGIKTILYNDFVNKYT